jgi:hypothetical protein
MAIKMIRDVIRDTIDEEMARDDSLIMLGEDIVGGNGSAGGPEAIGGIWAPRVAFGPNMALIASLTRPYRKAPLSALQRARR